MERRTFIKKGTLASVAAGTSLGSFAQANPDNSTQTQSAKDSWSERSRLPRDLQRLAGDSSLLKKPENLTVAAYLFPNYHPSGIHDHLYGEKWTEYNLVRNARPWFQGHQQPRGPLLGELDESLPST